MITLILFLFVVFILVIEAVSLWGSSFRPTVEFDVDTTLVEPGEITTLYYTVHNPYRLPLLFIGFSLQLGARVTLCGDGDPLRLHANGDRSGARVDHNLFLPAHGSFNGRLKFSLNERGLQELGRYAVQTGDYLGLYPIVYMDVIGRRIVCTSEKGVAENLELLGGEIGEQSVRRFILDDPTMLLGYRDYTGLEPMKQISWNQTAKVGRLMVRQHDYTTDRVAAVLVNMDCKRSAALEECLKLIRAVCEQLEESKIPYELISNGDLLSAPLGIGRAHLFFILRRLGLSKPVGFTTFESLVGRCVRRRRGNCTYIVITPEAGPDVRPLIDYLGRHTDSRPIVMIPDARN